MEEELIKKDEALALIASAKKNAERNYQGERRNGVLAGLRIAEKLLREMEDARMLF